MNDRGGADLTQLLERWSDGDPTALESPVDGVYPELHAIASRIMNRERPGTRARAEAGPAR